MSKSKQRSAGGKADKPDWRKAMGLHPDFPLFPHQAGWWAKKVRKRLHYFGKIADDPKGQAALEEWNRVRDDLLAGRAPRLKVSGVTVAQVCDGYLQEKDAAVASGELSQYTRRDYKRVTDRLVKQLGPRVVLDLRPEDFAELKAGFAKENGLVTLSNFILRVRGVFKWAAENQLIDKPVFYGTAFKPVRKEALKVHKASQPKKLFTAAETAALIDKAGVPLKAMVLLGINAGCGNTDCASLQFRHLDLEGGWLDFPRGKTGNERRCGLWPETVEALKAAINKRPRQKSADHRERVFITKSGGTWDKGVTDNPVSKEFKKVLKALKLEQQGRGFYSLRHTFRTIASGAKDLEAIRYVMGHTNGHVEAGYIEAAPEDERLRAVADHVRAWLFAKPTKGSKKPQKASTGLRVVG